MARHHGPTRGSPHPRVGPLLVVLAVLGTLSLLTGQVSVWGTGLLGKVMGNGTYQSGTVLLSDTIGGTNCLSSPNAAAGVTSNQTTCTTYPLSSTVGSSTTTLGNQGSISPTAASLSSTGSCGVQELADSSTAATNTGLPVGGVTYGAIASGPTHLTDSPRAITLDGTTGWGETLTGAAAPANYTVAAWVKPAALNGVIMGDTNVQYDTAPTDTDRMIWINTAGRIGFGNDATTLESTAAAALSTGTWYLIVATKSTTTGMAIYINGASNNTVASAPAKATLNYTGFWHLGWGSAVASAFTTLPTTNFFDGSLADEAVFPTALSAAQVTALYADTTQATFSTTVLADAPTSYWAMQDTGSTLYSGAIANLTANTSELYADESATSGSPNYGTGQGTLGIDASGPIAATATTFDGSTGWIETAVGDSGTFLGTPGPQTFSLAAWFKTSTAGDPIISYTNAMGDTADTMRDRGLWLDSSGHVVFGIYPGTVFEVNSAATTAHNFADGAWHNVVVTVTPVTATTGTVLMYLDGALVAGSASDETITASQTGQAYGGWWHLGWADMTGGWTDGPTGDFWNGSLGQIAVIPSVLSPANVTTLDAEPSAAAYASAVTGGVAASNAYWTLIPAPAPSAPACSYVVFEIQAGSGAGATCLYPVADTACPGTVAVTSWLSSVSATVPVALPVLTFTTSTTLGGVTPPSTGVGLHISVPLSITISAGGFSATLIHNVGYVLL